MDHAIYSPKNGYFQASFEGMSWRPFEVFAVLASYNARLLVNLQFRANICGTFPSTTHHPQLCQRVGKPFSTEFQVVKGGFQKDHPGTVMDFK